MPSLSSFLGEVLFFSLFGAFRASGNSSRGRHAKQSSPPLFVCILGGSENLPRQARNPAWVQRIFRWLPSRRPNVFEPGPLVLASLVFFGRWHSVLCWGSTSTRVSCTCSSVFVASVPFMPRRRTSSSVPSSLRRSRARSVLKSSFWLADRRWATPWNSIT